MEQSWPSFETETISEDFNERDTAVAR